MSTKKQYDVITFIGRMQPVHNAHLKTIRLAMELADTVVVVIGSANEPRTYFKNPFTASERQSMILDALCDFPDFDWNPDTLKFVHVENRAHSDPQWALGVRQAVSEVVDLTGKRVGKIGHMKDHGVIRVMNLFPEWDYVPSPVFEPLHSTHIRDILFDPDMSLTYLNGVVAQATIRYLNMFRTTDAYETLLREKKYIEDYQKQFAGLPYAPIFVTADAVVIQSGFVLMIKRKAEPGKGLWALPGGFVNAKTDKSVEDAAIRELFEETGIELTRKKETTEKILRKNIRFTKVFDAIDRSSRGRTITHTFCIVLDDGEWNMPTLKASDDAEAAEWIALSDLDRSTIFEDHADIIQTFVGML